jgi:hypothetical protein
MTYIDNRDWPEYNAQLVRRGEFYLDLSCVKNWSWELREMNRKKTGAPYKYPNTFITFASIIYSFLRLPYRQLEGFIGRLSTYEPGLVAADYTTLHKRISKQKLEIEIPENDAVVAVDSTGIKPTSRSKIISNHPLFWLILGSIIDIMSINARKLSHRFFQLVLAPSYSCSCHVQCANI